MPIRSGHGNGRGVPRIEQLPADELPAGMLADACAHPVTDRQAFERTTPGTAQASALAKKAADARWAKARTLHVLDGLGLKGTPPDVLAPYLDDAREFARTEIERLAQMVGGGACEGMAATMIHSAALQLAGSRAAFAAGDLALGSKLADASRQNCLAAFEVTAKTAKSRPRDPMAELNRRLGIK